MKRQNDKRSKLITSADQSFHEKGVDSTTLAIIAQLAEVPLGNVYYYFKSKGSIILAVIEYRIKLLEQLFAELNQFATPKERIKALLEKFIANSAIIAAFGDPIGSLCSELSKANNELHKAAINLMQMQIVWLEKELSQITKENAKQLAIHFIASLQGISLLTLTFKDPNYLNSHYQFMLNWLDNLK